MQRVEVQGAKVPAPGLGTWQLKGENCAKTVETALGIGYRHIDTAQVYENERMVGEGIKRSSTPRDEIFLTTKIWRDGLRTGELEESVQDSLDRLGTDYVDLLLIHWPFPELDLQESLLRMERLVEENIARHIGISNFTPRLMWEAHEASGIPLLTNQVEYHPYLSQDEVIRTCREGDMMLTSYSPLARGKATEDATLKDIGEMYGKKAAQVALRWNIQQENVCPIPKASNQEHLEQNFEIENFSLTEEEMNTIHGLASNTRKVNPGFAPEWD